MGEKMTIGEICNRTTVFANNSMTIIEAARLMLEQHVGSLVVMQKSSHGNEIVGMLTDRDIVVAVLAHNFNAHTLHVSEVMSCDPVTCRADESMTDVVGLMRRHGIRRVPVTDAQGTLLGIVTLDDLLEIVAEHLQAFVHVIDNERKREAHVRG